VRSTLVVVGIVAVFVALGVAALTYGGELGNFMLASLQAIPFLVLAALAQAGERRAWARVLAYLWLVGLVLGFTFLCLTLAVATQITSTTGGVDLGETGAISLRVLGAVLAAFLIALPTLFRPVRAALSRWIPISPESLVHKVALFILVFITLAAFGQLAVLGGSPPLLGAVESIGGAAPTRSSTGQILDLFYGLAWILPTTLVAAGYPLERTFREGIRRLGFTRPSRAQVLIGLGLAVALVGLFTGIDNGLAYIWQLLGWPTTDTEAFKKLVGAGFSPAGAVAIGITAGVGEEAVTRGLLQPRLGKLLPNLAFVSLHAFQYGPDALISVFIMGLILAFVRSWSNTTVAALVHGTYDFLVIMMEVLGLGF
jgi:membrane protease YdiL (CAAX protease family)